MIQSSRIKQKTNKEPTSSTSSLKRPLPAAPWEPESSAVAVSTSESSVPRKKKSTGKKNNLLYYTAGPDYSSNYEQQDYSSYSPYNAGQTLTASGSSYAVPDKPIPQGINAESLEKIISTTIVSTVQGLRAHTFTSDSALEKARLEKEIALAEMLKVSAVNASIANHALQTRLNDETLQDQRHRSQTEFNLRIAQEKAQFAFDLDHQAKLNDFKIADTAATNENERKLKFHNFQTNSQVKLMETTSTCNRNQAIFNKFGNVGAEEEADEDDE